MGGCSIDECTGVAHSRGMCPAHYQRWRKHGDWRHSTVPRALLVFLKEA